MKGPLPPTASTDLPAASSGFQRPSSYHPPYTPRWWKAVEGGRPPPPTAAKGRGEQLGPSFGLGRFVGLKKSKDAPTTLLGHGRNIEMPEEEEN